MNIHLNNMLCMLLQPLVETMADTTECSCTEETLNQNNTWDLMICQSQTDRKNKDYKELLDFKQTYMGDLYVKAIEAVPLSPILENNSIAECIFNEVPISTIEFLDINVFG